uniref:RNA-directed DNA polymerase n=1 Tax=Rhipicephalus microplus TaxID=6941 RepID=A0A6G5A9I5_RHIMP
MPLLCLFCCWDLEGRSQKAPTVFVKALSSFCLRSGVLYKRNFSSTGSAYLLVIPAALRSEVLEACHNEVTSGHLGYTRTLARVRQRYFWPRLTVAVKHHVRTCLDCQRRKSPPTKPAGLLQPVQAPRTPFDQIGMDILGPLPTSTAGNRWVIVATDYLTRYAETKAIQRGTAAEVAQFFIENVVLRHGAPSIVITDRGTAFTAALLEQVLMLSGATHRKTTADHPQTNGLTERLNKTIEDVLSMYVDVEHKKLRRNLAIYHFCIQHGQARNNPGDPVQPNSRKGSTNHVRCDASARMRRHRTGRRAVYRTSGRSKDTSRLANPGTKVRRKPLQFSSQNSRLPEQRQSMGLDAHTETRTP